MQVFSSRCYLHLARVATIKFFERLSDRIKKLFSLLLLLTPIENVHVLQRFMLVSITVVTTIKQRPYTNERFCALKNDNFSKCVILGTG